MIFLNPGTGYGLKFPSDGQIDGSPEGFVEEKTKEKEPDTKDYILCSQCHNIVTLPEAGISVQGAHRHTFANPDGLLFEIGCFNSASGCGYTGPSTFEFTWFKGFSWRVAICRKCLIHLGWFFTSTGGDSFHGLIMSRLTGTI
ncbi:MAG: hypothetical protein HN737_03140 [Desulfobacterales bacterium]|jgi:hypothetical protein|nr:hypothetical protein [Desulfobacteraceae bacterium]MBT4364819.1 hypothetical protein [Desulfobacteraceae bacterium]MBT7085174.1 hypothetical protein [Desulfobacterales bacterium]MBT7696386.1 hypothetical protein [Desulfobacterales bacterium]